MKNYKSKDDEKCLRIKPEGWVDDLVFGFGISSCGLTEHGMSVRINDDSGGVLTVDDLLQIRDAINSHLDKVINKTILN